jgi:hypothetical protein
MLEQDGAFVVTAQYVGTPDDPIVILVANVEYSRNGQSVKPHEIHVTELVDLFREVCNEIVPNLDQLLVNALAIGLAVTEANDEIK